MEQTKEVSLLAKFDELAAEMGSASKSSRVMSPWTVTSP